MGIQWHPPDMAAKRQPDPSPWHFVWTQQRVAVVAAVHGDGGDGGNRKRQLLALPRGSRHYGKGVLAVSSTGGSASERGGGGAPGCPPPAPVPRLHLHVELQWVHEENPHVSVANSRGPLVGSAALLCTPALGVCPRSLPPAPATGPAVLVSKGHGFWRVIQGMGAVPVASGPSRLSRLAGFWV